MVDTPSKHSIRLLPKILLLAVLLALVPACKRAAPSPDTTHEIATGFAMRESGAAAQLISGFYGVEGGTWRWTAAQFAVNLAQPAGASTRGATLKLRLTIPESTVEKLRQVTLTAKAAGVALPPQTFDKTGDYTFVREVPASAFSTPGPVRVDFSLDKAIPPSSADSRELGIVVSAVSLEPL